MNGWRCPKWIVGGGLVLAALACGRAPQAPGGEAQGVELHAYTVPEGYEVAQLRDYLINSMDTGETKLGTALKYPDGTLVVTASPAIHAGVRQLLADLEKRGPRPEQRPPGTVEVRYWILIARTAAGPGERVRLMPGPLREASSLRPVFDELVEAQGPLEFSLVEQIRLTSLDQGASSRTRGLHFEIEQKVLRPDGGSPIAEVAIRSLGKSGFTHSLDTRVRLDSGKYIVLGQTAYNARDTGVPEGWSVSDEPQLFYVITGEAA